MHTYICIYFNVGVLYIICYSQVFLLHLRTDDSITMKQIRGNMMMLSVNPPAQLTEQQSFAHTV